MKKILSLVVLVSLLLVLTASASAQEYTLRYGHVLNESHPFHEGFVNMAERVENRTDGDLQIEVFPSSQLGVEEDVLEQLRSGVPIAWNTDAARLGSYVPGLAVVNAPYFVDSIEDVEKLRQTPTMQKWEEELAEEYGIKILSFSWVQGFRHFMTNEPVRSPEDLDGLRIRTPPAPIWHQSVEALGAVPTAMNFGDIYTGIQQGSVDGAELVYSNIPAGNLFEVLDYVNETRHFLLVNFQVVSNQWFESLPEAYQEVLVEESNRAGLETSRKLAEQTEEIKQTVQEEGMTIVEDVDLEAFREAGMQAYEELDLMDEREQIYEEMEAIE